MKKICMSTLHHKASSGEGQHSSKWLGEDRISQVPSHHKQGAFLLQQHRSTGGSNMKATSMPLFLGAIIPIG